MTQQTNSDRMRDLIAELAPLEMQWEEWERGRFAGDGIQHVRRDGSVIVITEDSDPDDDVTTYVVGFYATTEYDADVRHTYCDGTDDLLLTIIEEGQSRASGSPWRLTGETDAAFAERSLRMGTMQP